MPIGLYSQARMGKRIKDYPGLGLTLTHLSLIFLERPKTTFSKRDNLTPFPYSAYTLSMRAKRIFIGFTAAFIFVAVPVSVIWNNHATPPAPSSTTPTVVSPLQFGSTASIPEPTTTLGARKSSVTTEKSKPWDKIDFGSRRLKNNVWGAPASEPLTSGVYLNGESFGWYWNRQNSKAGDVFSTVKPIYPSVRVGGSPWEKSNSEYFPIKLSDIKSLKFDVDYGYDAIPTGSYNLAYDMFLTDTSQPSPTPRIKAEIMVWIDAAAKKQLPITYKRDVSDGVNTYALYSWVMADGRKYYSFILKGEHGARLNVNAGRLMDSLELDPTLYVSGVELGNEIWDGSGRIAISQFNVTMNGAEL